MRTDIHGREYPDAVPLHKPKIVTDGGPWAEHDVACAVCRERKAVLEMGSGVFQPCWRCRAAGWVLVKRRPGWWGRR